MKLTRSPWAWAVIAVIGVVMVAVWGSSRPDSGVSVDRQYAIAEQIRCVQCNGETVAGSQTSFAVQARAEIQAQMEQGKTDDEILTYFVDSYGGDVSLLPPSTGAGALLWVLPVIVAVGAVTVAITRINDSRVELSAAARPVPRGRIRRRRAVLWGAVLVCGAGMGVALAQSLGARGSSTLTGGDTGPGSKLDQCRSLSMGQFAESISCFNEVLAVTPDNVEALSYLGWSEIRNGEQSAGVSHVRRAIEIDPRYPDAYVFLAVALKNSGDFSAAQSSLDTLYSLNPSAAILSIVKQQKLDTAIAIGLMNPATAACWDPLLSAYQGLDAATRTGGDALGAAKQLSSALECPKARAEMTPIDPDAALMWAFGNTALASSAGSSAGGSEVARPLFDRSIDRLTAALVARPNDPTLLVIRGATYNLMGNPAAAKADLEAAGNRSLSPLFAQIDVSAIRLDVEGQLAASTTTSR